jgi:hypothetical protein
VTLSCPEGEGKKRYSGDNAGRFESERGSSSYRKHICICPLHRSLGESRHGVYTDVRASEFGNVYIVALLCRPENAPFGGL